MTVLTRPDPRDFMALPRRDIDWPQALDADLKGKRIGLVHDIGAGLKPQPQVRDAIGAAARAFAGAGVEVTPIMPFLMAGDEIVILDIRHAARRWPWEAG